VELIAGAIFCGALFSLVTGLLENLSLLSWLVYIFSREVYTSSDGLD
jgi:hypothetical protein